MLSGLIVESVPVAFGFAPVGSYPLIPVVVSGCHSALKELLSSCLSFSSSFLNLSWAACASSFSFERGQESEFQTLIRSLSRDYTNYIKKKGTSNSRSLYGLIFHPVLWIHLFLWC